MATSQPSSCKSEQEEVEAFFPWVEYVQTVGECQDLEEKLHSTKVKNEALKAEYAGKLSEFFKEEHCHQSQAAYCKEINVKKEDLENMNVNGNIDLLETALAKQNKKYMEDSCVAIRNVEPTDKETLHSNMQAVCGHSELLKQLPLKPLFQEHMEIISDIPHALEDLKRITTLKEKAKETCEALEFLNSIKHINEEDS